MFSLRRWQTAQIVGLSYKVITTLSITKEAQDTMLDNSYASARTMGDFISGLIVDYHRRKTA
jgi:hypothetical protein